MNIVSDVLFMERQHHHHRHPLKPGTKLLAFYIRFNFMTFFLDVVQRKIFSSRVLCQEKKSPQVNRIELINVDNINHCFLSLFYQCLQLFGQPVKCLHVVE